MQHDDDMARFCQLVDLLRARGAVRVRSGHFEAAFAAPHVDPVVDEPKRYDGVSSGEAAELAELRAMRERMEEL